MLQDNTAPVAICQDITVSLNSAGNATVTAAMINDESYDNCSIASMSISYSDFVCDDVGQNTVTLTVFDVYGNSSTCSAIATIVDDTPPTALCNSITLQLDASGNGSITPEMIDNNSSDNCGVSYIELDQTDFTIGDVGSNTVTLTVYDNNGNENTCTATVEVEDNNAPNAICQNVTVQLNSSGTATLTPEMVDNGSNDASGIANLSLNITGFDCTDVTPVIADLFISEYIEGSSNNKCIEIYNGTGVAVNLSSYTLRVYNNGSVSSTSIILSGTIAHGQVHIVCNPGAASGFLALANQTSGSANFNGNDAVALEKSGTIIDIFGRIGQDPDPTPTVGWSQGGNSTVNKTLVRNANVIAGNISNTLDFPALATEWTQYPQDYISNLDIHTVNGINPVTLTVTDNNGNTSTCSATVTVEDNVAPVALCQNVTVQLDATGNGSTSASLVNNGSSDACGILSMVLSQTAFICSEVGANTETLTVTDVNGNVSVCTTVVTVQDNINPVALCQNVTVQLDASGNGSTTAAEVNNGSNDACGIQSLALDNTSFTCANVGSSNTVTLTVTDVNGNDSECTATVTVVDSVDPVAICQAVTVQLDASGNGSTTAAEVNNGSNDACGIQSLALDNTSFTCANVGSSNTVTLTVTDVNGNDNECTATVTVVDSVDPVATCQAVTVQLDASGNGSTTAAEVNNGSNDACGIQSLVLDNTSFTCANVGSSNTVTLTVTDVNGNDSECTATVTVVDSVDPVAICQAVSVQLDASGNGSTTAAEVNNGSNDACGIQSLALDNTSFTCANVGSGNTVTLTVTDVNGNDSECTATVTVVDSVDPVAICQAVTVQLDASGNGSTTAAEVNNGSNDACGIQSLALDNTSFTCANVGSSNTVTLTVTDVNGNDSECTATVTVVDSVDPVAICQAVTVQLDASGNGNTTAAEVNNGSNDACGIQSLALDNTSFTCANVGSSNTVTLTVTDVNGNDSECTATVTVVDSVDPVAICQAVTVQLDASGNGSTTAAEVNNGSNDACGIQSLALDNTSFTCANVGSSNTVTLTVTDVNGNDSECTATVTVVDSVDPVAICQAVTVQLDASGNGNTTAAEVNNGSNDACGIQSLALDNTSFTCANVGSSNTVTLIVTDVNGNDSECTATVTVVDSVDPVAICQAVTVQLDASGNGNTTAAEVNNGSNDACGIQSLALDNTSFTCANVGSSNTVTLTVTDVNGNDSECTATVTVVDSVDPVATCQAVTVQLDALGNGSTTAAEVNNGSNDACGIQSLALDNTSFTCANVGSSNTVTLTVTDVNGNDSECTATVTVVDSVDPVATCQAVTVQLDASGNGSTTAAEVNNGSNDACGIQSLALDNTSFTCANVGSSNTVTLTVTDVNGNDSECTATVTVVDSVDPVATCQAVTVQLDASGNGSTTAAEVNNGSNDACGIQSLALDNTSFTCANVGSSNTVTLTVTDVNGNDSECTATVTVVDSVDPVATCQAVTVQLDALGNGSTTAAEVNNGSNDACGIQSLALDNTSFTCANVGSSNTVTLTVTDVNGNDSECTATVTVVDSVDPVATCQAVTVQLDASGNGSTTAAEVNNGSNDACGIQSLALDNTSFTCANVGSSNTVTLTVTDVNGNDSECTATVTVVDSVDPVAICQAVTVQLDASGNGSTTAAEVNNGSNDACGIQSLALDNTSFTCANVGSSNTVTLTVTDVNGNDSECTATVTVVDSVDPVATCQAVTVQLDASGNGSTTAAEVNNGSNDACGIQSLALDNTSFTCANVGSSNTVTLTVTDVNGNDSECTATVTVVDSVDPVATCQAVTVQLDASGNGSTTAAEVNNGSNDACGIQSLALDNTSFTCANVGSSNTVTLTVTDVNGNDSECTATVTVVDSVDPVATCQAVTVQLDASGNGSTTAAEVNNGSNDACGIQSLALDNTSFTCANVGSSNTVTLTVTDVNGNDSECTATVTVVDSVDPVAICQAVTVQLDASGNGSTTAAEVNNGSNDACGIQSLALDNTSFTCANVGSSNTVTLTVTDVNGNDSECTATVTVVDSVDPVAICQAVTVQLDASGNGSTTAAEVNNGSNDACGIQSLALDNTSFTCANVGSSNTVTLTVTDVNGNDSECTATVTVVDSVDPVAICQAVTVQLDASGNGNTTAAEVNNGSNDACGIQSLALDNTSFTCANVGSSNTVTLTVTDVNGNDSECTATVTVVDSVDPVAICQAVTVQLDASGNGSTTAAEVNNGSNDACGIQSLALDNTSFTCANVGSSNTVTLTVTDVNGNDSECTATVTVVDSVDPVAICQAVTVQLDASGNGSTTAAEVNNGSNDACGIQSLALDNTSFTCANVGSSNTVTLTVTDVNGNDSECTATVTVVDSVDPVAICQAVTVQLDASGNGSTTAAEVNNGSNDACGIQSLALDNTSFTCANVGSSNTVTLTVTDVNGNDSECTATVTVVDSVDPVATCQAVTVQLDASGNGSTTAAEVNNGSNDACGIQSLALDNTSFTCANVGSSNTVTLTVTDVNGNDSECTATVTVVDRSGSNLSGGNCSVRCFRQWQHYCC
jgi:hypothetical protein